MASEQNSAKLRELNLAGSKIVPLDVFVDIFPDSDGQELLLGADNNVLSMWGFSSTKNGIATFFTSLKMLMLNLDLSDGSFDHFLHLLFELTHSPPLLIAFKRIHSTGLETAANTVDLRLVAYVFQVICRQIAPYWICPTPEMALECSRQVAALMYSLQPSHAPTRPDMQFSVHRVKIAPADDFKAVFSMHFPYSFDVDLPTHPSNPTDRVSVSLEKDDEQFAHYLGKALHKYPSAFPMNEYYMDMSMS